MNSRRAVRTVVSSVLAVAASTFALSAPARADAVRAGQWYLGPLGIEKAWSITRGAGVKVAVIDSGVDGRTPELRNAVVGGRDFSGQGSANGQAGVPSNSGPGHGTEVASLLAGRGTGRTSGVIGVAPRCSVLTASVVTGTAGISVTPIANAIRWSAAHGARVINLSLMTNTDSSAVTSAVRYAESKDVVLVAATGDVGINDVGPPASLPGVIAVSGIDRNLKADPDANFGHGVALAAPYGTTPSTGIPVADRVGDPRGAHSLAAGTSLSAPIVAGMAALIRAKFPTMDAANVINRLITTAAHPGGPRPDDHYGYGVPNAYKALTAHVPTVSSNPLGSLAPSGGGSTGSTAPAPSRTVTSAPAPTASAAASGASSSGAGAWLAIGAVVVVIAGLVGWFVARSRRSGALTGPPPGYGPGPPPGAPTGPPPTAATPPRPQAPPPPPPRR